jgi:hypothetical protein
MMRDAGFTLLEALIAVSLTLLVAAGAVLMMTGNVGITVAAPEAIDLSQRARAAAQVLLRDLELAGAGPTAGPRVGPLVSYFAPVLPRLPHVDAPATARSDALTIVAVPYTRAQGALALPWVSGAAAAVLAPLSHCAIGTTNCGFPADAAALVFDGIGNFDVTAVTDAEPTHLVLRPRLGGSGPAFAPGATFVEARLHGYYWDSAVRQLRHHDLDRTDLPVVDHVSHFVVDYFGDVSPPRDPRPPIGESNCLYDVAGTPRPELLLLAPPPFTLFRLALDRFTDGPWCGTGATQFDADLLRVRVIRITMRLEAGRVAVRGTRVPDLQFTIDVAPRNMGVLQ